MTDFISWTADFPTGIDIVDRQHRVLVDLVNEIAPLLVSTDENRLKEIAPTYQRLMDYAATHFRMEEEMMAELGVDHRVLEHHHQTHAGFVAEVQVMAREFTSGGTVTGTALFSFLASWLVYHILGEDQTMARQIAAIRAGATPEQAYLRAEGMRLDPTKDALANAMVACYTLMSDQNQSLTRISDHLLELVTERTAHLETMTEDLKQARDAAEAANLAKGRFLGMVSHELRTPMNAIIGFTEILHKEGLPPRQDALAGKIKTAADQLLELINGILEFSRNEAGMADPFDLRTLLTDACKAPFARARNKGLAVKLTIAPDLPDAFLGDARRLALVLGILAGNAAKFTTQGSVQVRAHGLPPDTDGKISLRFEVEDTGSGIPEAKRAGLFEAFHQLDDTATRQHGGIGIGLSLARQAVQMMQGEIGMDSPPGAGCTFWLKLRLVPTTISVVSVAPATHATELCPAVAPPAASPCDTATILATLVRLEQLLHVSDTRAVAVFEEATPCLSKIPGSHIDELAGQIAGFEFDRALPAVQALRQQIQESIS